MHILQIKVATIGKILLSSGLMQDSRMHIDHKIMHAMFPVCMASIVNIFLFMGRSVLSL